MKQKVTVNVNMEGRTCVKCGTPFKVLESSQQRVCSTACFVYGVPAPGAPERVTRNVKPPSGNVAVDYTVPTKPSNKSAHFIASASVFQRHLLREKHDSKNIGPTITQTKGDSMHAETNGAAATKNEPLPIRGKTTNAVVPKTPPPSVPAATSATPPVGSAGSQNNLELAALDIMSLSKKSAVRLHRIMRATVTKAQLEAAESGNSNLELSRVEMAIAAANAITGIVQSNVNLVKALRG